MRNRGKSRGRVCVVRASTLRREVRAAQRRARERLEKFAHEAAGLLYQVPDAAWPDAFAREHALVFRLDALLLGEKWARREGRKRAAERRGTR